MSADSRTRRSARDNVRHLKERDDTGSGDGGGPNMGERVTRLEANINHVSTQIDALGKRLDSLGVEVRADIRRLLQYGLAAVGFMLVIFLGAFGSGYLLLSDQINNVENAVIRLQERNAGSPKAPRLDQLSQP